MGILDTKHGMVEAIIQDIRLGFIQFVLTDELDPVSIWIQGERNIVHPTFMEFLLELDPQPLETSARMLQRTHRDTNLGLVEHVTHSVHVRIH